MKLRDNCSAVLLIIRIMVGSVFLSEGIQKFLFPAARGVGRFIQIGLPAPEFLGFFVPSFEVVCGVLVLIGWKTRWAAFPLMIIIIVAILSTKIPILLDKGIWQMAHEGRTDWSMLLGLIALCLSGSGSFSVDRYIQLKRESSA